MERDATRDLILAGFLALLLHGVLLVAEMPGLHGIKKALSRKTTITVGLVARRPAAEVRPARKGIPEGKPIPAEKAPTKPPTKKKSRVRLHEVKKSPKPKDVPQIPKPEPIPQITPKPVETTPEPAMETTMTPSYSSQSEAMPLSPSADEPGQQSVTSAPPGDEWGMEGGESTIGAGPFVEALAPGYGYRQEPHYPRLAVRRGYEGTTLLRVHIMQDGRVSAVEIKESSGYGSLDQAARNAVGNWLFTPARSGGRPVASWVLVPITFKLK
jgi:protein TonB